MKLSDITDKNCGNCSLQAISSFGGWCNNMPMDRGDHWIIRSLHKRQWPEVILLCSNWKPHPVCEHKNRTFLGGWERVDDYKCTDCGEEFSE